ncbi:MAG: tetratricopeptide repeat protein, partial [Pseudomonadota bacterium]
PRRVESFRRFDATWARSDRWAFVALPPGELPVDLRPDRAMAAISNFERLQGAAAALPAWEILAERLADNGLAHFGLGNARHATGDASGAITAFERAVDTQPDLAVAWLNLGLAMRGQGDITGAREALERAASQPGHWQPHAREALETLEER